MTLFAVGIEHPFDVPVQRSHHTDPGKPSKQNDRPKAVMLRKRIRLGDGSIANLNASILPAKSVPKPLTRPSASGFLDINRSRCIVNWWRWSRTCRDGTADQRSTKQSPDNTSGNIAVLGSRRCCQCTRDQRGRCDSRGNFARRISDLHSHTRPIEHLTISQLTVR